MFHTTVHSPKPRTFVLKDLTKENLAGYKIGDGTQIKSWAKSPSHKIWPSPDFPVHPGQLDKPFELASRR